MWNWRSLFGGRRPVPPTLDRALRKEIRRSFDEASRDEEHFPSTIDPRIRHVRVLLEFFGDLTDKKVLDAGCGKGRFARVLQEQNATARVTGFDISEAMLRGVPPCVGKVAGVLTALPFAAAAFDCVYATESLEHAVDTSTAVAELCRELILHRIHESSPRFDTVERCPTRRIIALKLRLYFKLVIFGTLVVVICSKRCPCLISDELRFPCRVRRRHASLAKSTLR